MIGMIVGVEDGVDMGDVERQALIAQVGEVSTRMIVRPFGPMRSTSTEQRRRRSGIVLVSRSPDVADPWHAAGRAGARNVRR